MKITTCIGYTNNDFRRMGNLLAQSIHRHTPDVKIRLVECKDEGRKKNMGTRFAAYVDESADYVFALDADSLCFGSLLPICERMEQDRLTFLGRHSHRPRKAPRKFNQNLYTKMFCDRGLSKLPMFVPNAYVIRGDQSFLLADAAQKFTEELYANNTHVCGNPLWSDQVGFTLAISALNLPNKEIDIFRRTEVRDWAGARKQKQCPRIIHFGSTRYNNLLLSGKLFHIMENGNG